LPIPPNVVPQIEQIALPFITRKNSIRIGSGISTTGQNSFQKLSNGQGTAQTNSKYHLAQSPTHTPSILPFGVKSNSNTVWFNFQTYIILTLFGLIFRRISVRIRF
jgi:hypothetical protein